jgi:hypothetical protein
VKAYSAATLVLIAFPIAAGAQSRSDVAIGPLLSIQPVGYHDALPYLDNGISGSEPGLSAALHHRTGRDLVLALELSVARKMSVSQSGRLVFQESGAPCGPFSGSGCGPAEARHSDTLVSALAGKRFARDRGGVELMAGPGLIVGKPQQNDFTIEDAAGHVALTAGIDGEIPLSDRLELAVSARYSRALRGDRDFYVGLGSTILRIGLSLRVRISGR